MAVAELIRLGGVGAVAGILAIALKVVWALVRERDKTIAERDKTIADLQEARLTDRDERIGDLRLSLKATGGTDALLAGQTELVATIKERWPARRGGR